MKKNSKYLELASIIFSNKDKYNKSLDIKEFLKSAGCDDVAIDLVSSVASVITTEKKYSPSRIVICGSFGSNNTIVPGMYVGGDVPIGSLFSSSSFVSPKEELGLIKAADIKNSLGSFLVCKLMESLVCLKSDILFNVHGVCYAGGVSGMKAALSKLKPIVVVSIEPCLDIDIASGPFIEVTPFTNSVLYDIFMSCGKFGVVAREGDSSDSVSHIGGGNVFMRVLLPAEKSSFYIGDIRLAVSFLKKILVEAPLYDFRGAGRI